MNELIFELAKQADLIQWDTLPSGARTPDHESVVKAKKFAELIVRECMMLCGAISGASQVTRPNDAFGDGAEKCKALINQHFGVKS